MSAQHSSATNEHYTPKEIIDAVRTVMGGIDLDPASCEIANRTVKARNIFTQLDDGLIQEWHGRVWLNPPGGRIGNKSSAAVWWNKLALEWRAGSVKEAIFLGFSIELLQNTQWCIEWPGDAPFCIPRRRIQFVRADGTPGDSPTHANVIVYLPDYSGNVEWAKRKFKETFEPFGRVCL